MTLYSKVLSAYWLLRSAIDMKLSKYDVADAFNPDVQYTVGRIVVYDNALWSCTVSHKGAWNADHFKRSNIDGAISSDVGNRVDAKMEEVHSDLDGMRSAIAGKANASDVDDAIADIDSALGNKADKAELQYGMVQVGENGLLTDRAVNHVTIDSQNVLGFVAPDLILPPFVDGRARNFRVYVKIYNAEIGRGQWKSRGDENVTLFWEDETGFPSYTAAGWDHLMFSFIEMEPHSLYISMKNLTSN